MLLSPVSCLLSPFSCLLSPVSCLLSPVSCLLSPVSCLLSPVSCLLSPVSCLLSSPFRIIDRFGRKSTRQELIQSVLEFFTGGFFDIKHVTAFKERELNIIPDRWIQIHTAHHTLGRKIWRRQIVVTAADPYLQI